MRNVCLFAIIYRLHRLWRWSPNSHAWHHKSRSWKITPIKWATIYSHSSWLWALSCAFSNSFRIVWWFTEQLMWVNDLNVHPFRKVISLLSPQQTTREVSVWLAINLCTIIYVFIITVFIYDMLVVHESYIEFSNVLILEGFLFITNGKRHSAFIWRSTAHWTWILCS